MAVTLTRGQHVLFPPPQLTDEAGQRVPGLVTIAESSGGQVVSMAVAADGSAMFTAVAPGTVFASWECGGLAVIEEITVT